MQLYFAGTLLAAKQCLVHLAMKNKMPTHLLLGYDML